MKAFAFGVRNVADSRAAVKNYQPAAWHKLSENVIQYRFGIAEFVIGSGHEDGVDSSRQGGLDLPHPRGLP
jgi:hypothetical protein